MCPGTLCSPFGATVDGVHAIVCSALHSTRLFLVLKLVSLAGPQVNCTVLRVLRVNCTVLYCTALYCSTSRGSPSVLWYGVSLSIRALNWTRCSALRQSGGYLLSLVKLPDGEAIKANACRTVTAKEQYRTLLVFNESRVSEVKC